jgi:RNA polymerase subunit RPABC4/transcription elongation factor Spt4
MPADFNTGDEIDDEEPNDRDLPDPSDMDQDDYTVMSRCPYCKKMIDEQSEVCPKCGQFISSEDEPRPYPWWLVVVIVLAVLTMVLSWWH